MLKTIALATAASVAGLLPAGPLGWAGESPAPAASAAPLVISTSLAIKDRHSAALAFDGKAETCFRSKDAAQAGDDVTVVLPAQCAITGITVSTGTAAGQDRLDQGRLEVSTDGTAFMPAAAFAAGKAAFTAPAGSIHAFRIVVGHGASQPLAISEIALAGLRALPPLRFATRFQYDYADAPEVAGFAVASKALLEEWYPRFSDQFDTPEAQPQRAVVRVTFELKEGVAYTTTGRDGVPEIHVCKDYVVHHPDDTGLMVHECFHIVQGYTARGHDHLGWLTEGLADYARNRLFRPVVIHPDPDKAKYTDAYTTTAAFLMWLEDHKKKGICFTLNAAMRITDSTVLDVFTAQAGADVEALWKEYIDAVRKGGV